MRWSGSQLNSGDPTTRRLQHIERLDHISDAESQDQFLSQALSSCSSSKVAENYRRPANEGLEAAQSTVSFDRLRGLLLGPTRLAMTKLTVTALVDDMVLLCSRARRRAGRGKGDRKQTKSS